MNHTKIQKFIASILIPFFLFGLVFKFPLDFFNISEAGDSKLYSIVSILVNQDIYSGVKDSLETYSKDISKQLNNTKVIIIPTPNNTPAFNIASLNENLYYEGYEGIVSDANFKSRLVGTVLVGNFNLPIVSDGNNSQKTILPYVDFEDKVYIYDHKTNKYIKNSNNIDPEKPEIWHGVISPNTGNKVENINKINDFFKKDHDFYEGTGNFKKEIGVINGKNNEKISNIYDPFVFYFDQFREQQSFIYSKYKGYQAYLNNKEDITYHRYSKELSDKINKEVLDKSNESITNLLSGIDPSLAGASESPDISKTPDITLKYIIDKVTSKFLETINGSKIGEFRKDVNNSGRYSKKGNKVNVDFLPYFISILDNTADGVLKEINDDLENEIDNVVKNSLAKDIKILNQITAINDYKHGYNYYTYEDYECGTEDEPKTCTDTIKNNDSTPYNCNNLYRNYFNGKTVDKIEKAEDCTIFRGSSENGGQLVESNRGYNVFNSESDSNLCKKGKPPRGYYHGSTPTLLDKDKLPDFEIEEYNRELAIRDLFDPVGSKLRDDASKIPSPLNCLEKNYIPVIILKGKTNNLWNRNGFSCENIYTLEGKNWSCKSDILGKDLYEKGDREVKTYKYIPSYITHKSPTNDELEKQLVSKISPNLPIDKERYIDFFSEEVDAETGAGKDSYKKIVYPNLFEIKGYKKNVIEYRLNSYLNAKSTEIKNIGGNIDLLKTLKDKGYTKLNIGGEEKKVSYYDYLVFSIYWNNISSVGEKYKYVFENYLIDQVGNENGYFLPKNKKIYDIAYIGAPGNYKNMFVGVDPENKGTNPFTDIESKNAILNADLFSYRLKDSDLSEKKSKPNFKCAPAEGVELSEWWEAIQCWVDNIGDIENFVNVNSNRCSSETLFLDEIEDIVKKQNGEIIDVSKTDDDVELEEVCRVDLDENGVEDCLQKDLKDAKIILVSSSKKTNINSYVGLEAKIVNSEGKTIKSVNNIKTTFKLVRLESLYNSKNKVLYDISNMNELSEKNKNKYINFNEYDIPVKRGISKFGFNSKDKESNYYFKAVSVLKGKNKEEILKIESDEIKVEVRNEVLISNINSISGEGELISGGDDTLVSDSKNIYLIDLNNGNINSKLEQIKSSSNSEEKIVISLAHYSNGTKKIGLNYPLKISLTKDGKKVVTDLNITKENLKTFMSLYSLKESGEYKIKIINSFGETTSKTFTLLPEKARKVDLKLSTNILERGGNLTSNIVVLKDKFGNVSNGYKYKLYLESQGDFKFPITTNEFVKNKSLNIHEGYKGFRIKPDNYNSVGNIKVSVKYNDEIIAIDSKLIQTIEKINIDLQQSEKIIVGGNDYKFKLEFNDKQGNLLKNLNTRVYFVINEIYGKTTKPYFEVKNGKAEVEFISNNISGEDIPVELQIEGLREIIKKKITINPEKAIKIDFNTSKNSIKASENEKIKLDVLLKDRYNNTVFNNNSTKIKLDIPEKYKTILTSGNLIKTSIKGKSTFDLSATNSPGTAYFKISTIPDLSNNFFEITKKDEEGNEIKTKIFGIGEKSGKIKTHYFWNKDTFKGKKFNSLYTVMLGANYGDISKKDYLAGSILFDKENRNLAITSLLNNPFENPSILDIFDNGKVENVSDSSDLSQDIYLTPSLNSNNKLFLNIFNKGLNTQIGEINYKFFDTTELGICEDSISNCLIKDGENSIYLKSENDKYITYKKGPNIYIKKEGINILEINKVGSIKTKKVLKYEVDFSSNEKYLVINIIDGKDIVSKLIINTGRIKPVLNILDSSYGKTKKNGKISVYYDDLFGNSSSLNSFSKSRVDNIDNFNKKGSIGWKGENKFLLDFSSGKNVGESVKNKQSFSTIILGDPVISLKPVKNTFKNGDEKSFDSTIGKKISNDSDIQEYKVFDYDNDNLDDILLIKNNGYLKLLENKSNANDFLNKGNIAFVVDIGEKKFIHTGDFTGDGFDDIFFINNKGVPNILNNKNKDFKRFNLFEQFKDLKGKIIQVESFDMDNDTKSDIITLDDSGEINIFYGGIKYGLPSFEKKFVGTGFDLKLNSDTSPAGGLVYFDGLYQIGENPGEYNYDNGVINYGLLDRQIFVKLPFKKSGEVEKITFIKSEYSIASGVEVIKEYSDINGGNLKSGDIVDVKITIKNISDKVINNLYYIDKIQKPFKKTSDKILVTKGKIFKGPPGYNYKVKDFTLGPDESNVISYKLITPNINYGNIKVGLFEKGEFGDDLYGDIILKNNNENCSQTVDFYKSNKDVVRDYGNLSKKEPTCDPEKLKVPEELSKNEIDDDKNGIPDYIDNITADVDSQKEYAIKAFKDFKNQESDDNIDNKFIKSMYNIGKTIDTANDDIKKQTDRFNREIEREIEDIDNLIDGFTCGFGGSSCIATPLNWAPLAPGNDPVLFGKPIGDGLNVGEGIPIFSTVSYLGPIPGIWPPFPGGAGGYLGIDNPSNVFRLFITPTLTGGVGTAMCFGGSARIFGNLNPVGVHPIIPGGNCIVLAKKFSSCSNDSSEGDPESIGKADSFGGEDGFGVINGNCSGNSLNNSNNGKSSFLDKDFVKKYYEHKVEISKKDESKLDEIINNLEDFSDKTKKSYLNIMKNFSPSTTNDTLFSLNGEGVGESSIEVNLGDIANIDYDDLDVDFEDIIEISQNRISAFPSFFMDWSTRQIEEIVTKLADFPTLFLILPDFSGIIDADWTKVGKEIEGNYKVLLNKETNKNIPLDKEIQKLREDKLKLKCFGDDITECYSIDKQIQNLDIEKRNNYIQGHSSGIKYAYEFLGNVPIINIEPQQVNVEIPWIDENTLNKFLVDAKTSKAQWEDELKRSKLSLEVNTGIQNLILNLEQNIEIVEEYKKFPRRLAKLLNQKDIWVNQVMCNVEGISEITSGWIGRNGKRFRAWVETYILVKAILKSWQGFIDVFTDYKSECQECKNERNDSIGFQFKLIDSILPKIPVIQFPKWPDIILDLHNIRASIDIKIPDIVIQKRPVVLPNIPDLILPEFDLNVELIPEMPLLPRFNFPELPDLPTLPEITLPDLPPPPKLPKIFSELEGVLKIVKLITKAMCLLKNLPFVPEWRAGDQIAFLTERDGFLPTDFIDLSLPNFPVTYIDALKATVYVNLEVETDYLAEVVRNVVEPFNNNVNNSLIQFNNLKLNDLDFSSLGVNLDIKSDLKNPKKDLENINDDLKNIEKNIKENYNDIEEDMKIGIKKPNFSELATKEFLKLYSYINKDKDKEVNSKDFLNLINKSLASNVFTQDSRSYDIKKIWSEVNNYSYSKEEKLINNLLKSNSEKFSTINDILINELDKNYKLQKSLEKLLKDDKKLFIKVVGKNENKDFVEYKKRLDKYNKKFFDSAKALVTGGEDRENSKIKKESNKLLASIKGGLQNYNNSKILNKVKNNNNRLLSMNTTNTNNNVGHSNNNNGNLCQQSNNSDYKYTYKGLYIVEKNKSYKLFNYLDELTGDEKYSQIDYNDDGYPDLLYIVNGDLYLKENYSWIKENNSELNENNNSGFDPFILKISDNRYFNGDGFIEAVNGFKEINTDNGYLNLVFNSPTDENIKHFNVEYYTIVDKFLNKNIIGDGIKNNIIDAFVNDDYIKYEKTLVKKHKAFISYAGDIGALNLYTTEMINLLDSLKSNSKINISSTTPIYTGKNDINIKYYFGDDEDKIFESTVVKNSSIQFKEKITIVGINGELYVKGKNNVNLFGNEIRDYIGLPLFDKSEISIVSDFKSRLGDKPSVINIKYSSGYEKSLDFQNINLYSYINLGDKKNNYLIRTSTPNDYFYGKIYSIKGKERGTYSKQILFSPQKEADVSGPEVNLDLLGEEENGKIYRGKIRIPIYQKKIIDITKIINDESGIKNIEIKPKGNNYKFIDRFTIIKENNSIKIKFGKFNNLFKEKLNFILEDNIGNKSSTIIDFEVYSPKPEILSIDGNLIKGKIDENLFGEPINLYRVRSGVIKRLVTKDDEINVKTIDNGHYNFNLKSESESSSGLLLKYFGINIANINEITGKINLLNSDINIKVGKNNLDFPEINIYNLGDEKIYSESIRLEDNINIKKVNSFENIEENGIYIKISPEYSLYSIPNGSNYSAGANVIYKKSNNNKKRIFTIFPDGRIKYNEASKLEYESYGENIVFKMNSIIGNNNIGEILYKIKGTYLMK